MKKINVALLGFGTVGRGTFKVLLENEKLIEARYGFRVNVKKILEINQYVIKASGLPKRMFTADINDILDDPAISIVVEVMGGRQPAANYMLRALNAKKNVVSSNKLALAENIQTLKAAAVENGVQLLYEASVCGAIPVLSAIKGNLSANKFTEIRGIVNGTSNYILTQMTENSMKYEAALAKAQELGFAEADPTADVEGIDAVNKICLLADIAMGYYRKPELIKREGISQITAEQIEDARAQDCKIKLIAKAKLGKNGIVLSVKPELVKSSDQLYNVDYEFNGITLRTDCADEIFFYGRGAGSVPTGSAVAGDILSIAKLINMMPAKKAQAAVKAEAPAVKQVAAKPVAAKKAVASTKAVAAKKTAVATKQTTAKKAAAAKPAAKAVAKKETAAKPAAKKETATKPTAKKATAAKKETAPKPATKKTSAAKKAATQTKASVKTTKKSK